MRGFFRKSLLTCILYLTAKVILRRLYHCCIPMHTGLCQMTFSAWNLQNALPVKLHSWSVEGSFEGSFVHTCFGALNCSTLVSTKGCVSSERGPVHLNSDWINSSMSFRVSSQSESNCMELIWKGGLFELSWDLWKGVSRMNQFCRSSGWWIDCTTSWEEFIPGVFVQRLPIISWSVAGFRGEFCFGSYRSPQCTVISLYLLSKQVS